jgi:class 3 adenylate cyclase
MPYQETNTRAKPVSILVVDDDALIRDMLVTMVQELDFEAVPARNGAEAMEKLELQTFALVLLDLAMPEVDGYQVLLRIKDDLALRHIPVIVISGMSRLDNAVECLEKGATDFLPKPVNFALLKARIHSCLNLKRLGDLEQEFLQRLEVEQERAERLLLNVLPRAIAERLKQGECNIAEFFADCTVLFSNLVGFSQLTVEVPPADLIQTVNRIFSAFDRLAEGQGLEKIKSMGDTYMVVAGVPNWRTDHAEAVAELALHMRDAIKTINASLERKIKIRIGISTGPVVAGIVGEKKFSYDLWGETVNLASRMQFLGRPGCIQVGPATYERLKDKYYFERSSVQDVEGTGQIDSYLLMGR